MALPQMRPAAASRDAATSAVTAELVIDALRSVGLEPVAPFPLHPAASAWSAVSVEGVRFGAEVVGPSRAPATVRGGDHAGRVRHRARVLADLPHLSSLSRTVPPVDLPHGRVLVATEVVTGPGLDVLVDRGATWRPGQILTVLLEVARALALLHENAVIHGRVRARDVAVRPDGGVVLTGLVPVGTPEVAAGSATEDVRRLVEIGLGLLARAATPAEPGQALRELLETCAAQPPSASALVGALRAVGPTEDVPVTERAMPAGQSLRDLSVPRGSRASPRRGPRHRRPSRARHLVPVLVAGVMLAGVGGASARFLTSQAVAAPDPVAAALRLTEARAEALASGDGVLLRSVTVPGSPAAAADVLALRRAERVRPESLEVDLRAARLVDPSGTSQPSGPSATARVRVTARVAAVQVDGRPGEPDRAGVDSAGAGVPVRSVVLVLRLVEGSWRVEDVETDLAPPPG